MVTVEDIKILIAQVTAKPENLTPIERAWLGDFTARFDASIKAAPSSPPQEAHVNSSLGENKETI